MKKPENCTSKAIDNFDTTLQVKFSTYAVPMIVGEIRRYLRDNNSIRVSRSLRDIAYKTIYTRENYMRQHLKAPTIAEILDVRKPEQCEGAPVYQILKK